MCLHQRGSRFHWHINRSFWSGLRHGGSRQPETQSKNGKNLVEYVTAQ